MFTIRSPISDDVDTYYSFSNNLKNVSNLEFKNKNISSTYVLHFTDKINKLNGLYWEIIKLCLSLLRCILNVLNILSATTINTIIQITKEHRIPSKIFDT